MNLPDEHKRLLDPQYWRAVCPNLTVSEQKPLSQNSQFGSDCSWRANEWELCKDLIQEDGYFAYPSYFPVEPIDSLSLGISNLHEAGLIAAFGFVYDEFWDLLLGLRPLLQDLIGDYQFLPAVWAWYVRPDHQSAFAPHRDQVRDVAIDDDDHLDYLTVWIPLTDLTHLSSCICVLPASADPDYDEGTDRVCVEDLQEVRTLQGKRGSIFCWTTGLAHWGTKQTRHGPPRMSVGLYVQRDGAECLVPPPLNFDEPFSLVQRLRLIGNQIINYSRDADDSLLELASRLIEMKE